MIAVQSHEAIINEKKALQESVGCLSVYNLVVY